MGDISALLYQLSEQHAQHGHIDVSAIRLFCESLPAGVASLDARIISRISTLQGHVLSDLKKVGNHPSLNGRIDECLALNELLRAYLRS